MVSGVGTDRGTNTRSSTGTRSWIPERFSVLLLRYVFARRFYNIDICARCRDRGNVRDGELNGVKNGATLNVCEIQLTCMRITY